MEGVVLWFGTSGVGVLVYGWRLGELLRYSDTIQLPTHTHTLTNNPSLPLPKPHTHSPALTLSQIPNSVLPAHSISSIPK